MALLDLWTSLRQYCHARFGFDKTEKSTAIFASRSANGPPMEVRKRDFGLEYKASLSRDQGDAPAWEVRLRLS